MDEGTPQIDALSESWSAQPRAFRDILIVGSPIIVFGIVGNLVGLSTLLGGAIINLGYVLMLVLGGILLKAPGQQLERIRTANTKEYSQDVPVWRRGFCCGRTGIHNRPEHRGIPSHRIEACAK